MRKGVNSDGLPPPLGTTALRRASLALSQYFFKPTCIIKPALEVRSTGRHGMEDASHTAHRIRYSLTQPSAGQHQAHTRWSFRVVHCAPFASRCAPVPYHCNLPTRCMRVLTTLWNVTALFLPCPLRVCQLADTDYFRICVEQVLSVATSPECTWSSAGASLSFAVASGESDVKTEMQPPRLQHSSEHDAVLRSRRA